MIAASATILDCPPERAWQEVQTSRLLVYITAPLVRFVPVDPPALPAVWSEERYLVQMRLFGILPFGTQWIVITRPVIDATSLHAFTDGPRRTPAQVDPGARERTRLMTVRLLARPPVPDAAPQPLDPPTATRLGEIRPPTLVVVGAEDQPAIHAIADRLCADIPHARKIVIPDAGHHPNLEQPGLFDELLRQFVDRIAAA